MRMYVLGIITMFFVGFALQLTWYKGLDTDNDIMLNIGYYGGEAIRGIYFVKPLTNRCTTERRCDSLDCATNIEYFNCDYIQVKINELLY